MPSSALTTARTTYDAATQMTATSTTRPRPSVQPLRVSTRLADAAKLSCLAVPRKACACGGSGGGADISSAARARGEWPSRMNNLHACKPAACCGADAAPSASLLLRLTFHACRSRSAPAKAHVPPQQTDTHSSPRASLGRRHPQGQRRARRAKFVLQASAKPTRSARAPALPPRPRHRVAPLPRAEGALSSPAAQRPSEAQPLLGSEERRL
mmetsp:Transcript_17783/g.55251  ORF Transcript_17783/g.55251 Transcript_17783/m.55251 type:complete len:212 (-) Transcript_17783:87-722(-)